jgi:hypothetical protein
LRDVFSDMHLDGSFLPWSDTAEPVAVFAYFAFARFIAGIGSAVDFVLFAATVFFDTALADLVVVVAAFDERFTVVLRTLLESFSSIFLARFVFRLSLSLSSSSLLGMYSRSSSLLSFSLLYFRAASAVDIRR